MDTEKRIQSAVPSWYVLYTSAQAEKQVCLRLLRKGVETWLPLHRAPRVWSDRIKIVDVPLFRSYIFVKCSISVLYTLTMVYGVSRVVMYNGVPATLREKEIEAIKEFLQLAEKREIIVGDEVEVLSGPMKRLSGKVKRIRNGTVQLYLEQMGMMLQIPIAQVGHSDRLR